jgi:sugar lactone lactonase YvrE
MSTTAIATEPVALWETGATLGEGVLWDADRGHVWFVDIKGRRLHRCAPDGSDRSSWDAPGQISFAVRAGDGSVVVSLDDGLYRFDGARVARMDDGYIITNGPAVSADGRTLYHTDTLAKRVYAFDLAPDGSLAHKRLFAENTDGGHPDGMAVDAEGHVWIAVFGGWRIERRDPLGRKVGEVRFPCANITKLAFAGDDLRTVYATSARKGLSPEDLAAQPLAGALFTFRAAVAGLPHHVLRLQE